MKKNILVLLVFTMGRLHAQFDEISLGTGFAYYYGDLNTTNTSNALALFGESFDLKNFRMSYSIAYRYNFKQQFSIGLNFYHMYLAGYDSDNQGTSPTDADYGRKVRNLSFHTVLNQGFVDIRFEPLRLEKSWSNSKWMISPFISAGFGFFQFNPKTMLNGSEVELQPLGTEGQGLPGYDSKYRTEDIAIPIDLGLKIYHPSRKFAITLDFNYNFTLTDYIDDVSNVYANQSDFQAAYQVKNPTLYNLVTALSDRSVNKNGPGQVRGHTKNDQFMTGQIKFSYFLYNKRYRD